MILDLGLPDGDECDFISEVLQWSTLPVILLSARVDEQDKIEALDAGADDYATKPFRRSAGAGARDTRRKRSASDSD